MWLLTTTKYARGEKVSLTPADDALRAAIAGPKLPVGSLPHDPHSRDGANDGPGTDVVAAVGAARGGDRGGRDHDH